MCAVPYRTIAPERCDRIRASFREEIKRRGEERESGERLRGKWRKGKGKAVWVWVLWESDKAGRELRRLEEEGVCEFVCACAW